jgi:DNA-directed RNA polymerase specialized sigma24 family protein
VWFFELARKDDRCGFTPFLCRVNHSAAKLVVAVGQETLQKRTMERPMVKKIAERNHDSVDERIVNELRTANRLLAILATRGMEQRDAIALLHGMSFSPRAIAAALSVTPNAVSVAIHRLKKAEQPTSQKTSGTPSAIREVEQNG